MDDGENLHGNVWGSGGRWIPGGSNNTERCMQY